MLKKEIMVLYYGFQDKRTATLAKIPALIAVLYLLSPIDIIPDFIPFVGYLDDVVIVPLLLNASIRLLPAMVREESVRKAVNNKKKFTVLGIFLIIILLALLTGSVMLIVHLVKSR
jgi:uncharacterized membrane protein YkvA (DUF1232 family)